MSQATAKSDLYKEAGVDIDLAQDLLGKVKSKIASTRRPEMLAPIGGFGGLFQLDLSKYKNPVLVSSIDGVGTKLMIADMMNKFDTVGYDIVNHCINDIAVQGAEPVYFLDYLGIGKLRSPLYEQVLEGIADACASAGCAVLGGETAEMPGMYGDDFDLVGVITGIVEKDQLITGENIRPGHVAIALPSNGLHTNGYSLARKILFEKCQYSVETELPELAGSIGESLLLPHICYWPAISEALNGKVTIDGMAHITGGGIFDNVPRILPPNVDFVFDRTSLSVPPIMSIIVEAGNISPEEAHRVFNMGVGMIWFVPPDQADSAIKSCQNQGCNAVACGEIVPGNSQVKIS